MKRILLIITILATLLPTVNAQKKKVVESRVMTFNVRTLNSGDGCNNWEMRYHKVGKFINKTKADIVGLQEVQPSQLSDLASVLSAYSYIGQPRDDGKEKGEYNPIFYNKEKYNMLRSGTFWLSPTPQEPSYGWDAACRRIATWAILQEKVTMKSIIVVNTHLDHVGSQARINSAALIKERIGRMSNELPVIITGDMNVEESDPVYAKMMNSIFLMQDACKAVKKVNGPAYTFHDFGRLPDDECSKIDYIFLTTQVKVNKATVHNSALGKGFYLSDHNALTADIAF